MTAPRLASDRTIAVLVLCLTLLAFLAGLSFHGCRRPAERGARPRDCRGIPEESKRCPRYNRRKRNIYSSANGLTGTVSRAPLEEWIAR